MLFHFFSFVVQLLCKLHLSMLMPINTDLQSFSVQFCLVNCIGEKRITNIPFVKVAQVSLTL